MATKTRRHLLVSFLRIVCGIACMFSFVPILSLGVCILVIVFEMSDETDAERMRRLLPFIAFCALLIFIWLASRHFLFSNPPVVNGIERKNDEWYWNHLAQEFEVIEDNGGLLKFVGWVVAVYLGVLLTGWLGLGIDMRPWVFPCCLGGGGGGGSYYPSDGGPDPWDNLP